MKAHHLAVLLTCVACGNEPRTGVCGSDPEEEQLWSGSGKLTVEYTGPWDKARLVDEGAFIGSTGNYFLINACDDSGNDWRSFKLEATVPIPSELPSALGANSDTLPSAEGKITYCQERDCPKLSHATLHSDHGLTYEGQILAYDPEAGHLKMDFSILTGDGRGGILRLDVAGEFDWDSDYQEPDIGDLSGRWLITPRTDAGADFTIGLDLSHQGARLSGLVCDGDFACEDLTFTGYISAGVAHVEWTDPDKVRVVLKFSRDQVSDELKGSLASKHDLSTTRGIVLSRFDSN